jgi:putative colanic acid biosynthesis glycosyltransferase
MIWGMNSPVFSIITVTLNNLSGLKRTHQSLLEQTVSDLEWIVIDGGSTDCTTGYLKTTKALWVSEPDNGIYDAMNKGIEKATGEYLLFLNAGDELATSDVLEQLSKVARDSPDFMYGDYYLHENKKKFYKKSKQIKKLSRGMITSHQAMIYSRKKLEGIRYDLNYQIAADYDLTLKFLMSDKKTIKLTIPICIFESGGLSEKKAFIGRFEQYKIRKNLSILPEIENLAVFFAQFVPWNLRKKFPKLYWFIESLIIR